MSPQAYYQYLRRRERVEGEERWVVLLVRQIRKRLPFSGGENLWGLVQKFLRFFKRAPVGRDRLARIVRENSLKVTYLRPAIPKTTYSKHPYVVAPNLLRDFTPTAPEQVLVGDITYLRTAGGHAYLFLLTDAHTRLIAGYHVSSSLRYHGAEKALRKAVSELTDTTGIIHHTDRGSQYCCHNFQDALAELGIKPSTTDADHAAQNAQAESLNGILKKELGLWNEFETFNQAKRAVDDAIFNYNHIRTHGKLKGASPFEFHFGDGSAFINWANKVVKPVMMNCSNEV